VFLSTEENAYVTIEVYHFSQQSLAIER